MELRTQIHLLGLGFAAQVLLLSDECRKLLTKRHLFSMGLLDEGVFQEVGHRRTRLKVLYQTPAEWKNMTTTFSPVITDNMHRDSYTTLSWAQTLL